MVETIRLDPHDPLPDRGPYVVVMRRFGEDDPNATVLEIIEAVGAAPPERTAAVGADGRGLTQHEAEEAARRIAKARGMAAVYVVDRTAGAREAEILAHHGDHSVHMEALEDSDPEDGEEGTSLRDRPSDAGFLR